MASCHLAQWLLETFRVRVATQTLSRELRAMGYRNSPLALVITPRSTERLRVLKKNPSAWRRSRATRAGPLTSLT